MVVRDLVGRVFFTICFGPLVVPIVKLRLLLLSDFLGHGSVFHKHAYGKHAWTYTRRKQTCIGVAEPVNERNIFNTWLFMAELAKHVMILLYLV